MSEHLPSPVKYREDINGLRAWAVIAVLLFHFSLIGLSGGFAGVDLFFVISGYLMTAIIVTGHEKGSFSIWKFYMSRVRRIVPALLVVIAVLLILGWFYLPTPDYQELGKQSAYSLGFFSNIGYWRSAGYFDSAAHEKWLLHTWSLAVEAQFYLLYPMFIALVWKFWKSLKAVNIAIIILFVGSLILNLYASERFPGASFYLLPTRGWELTAGGLVFLAIRYNLFSNSFKNIGYWLGWIFIIGSFSFISKDLLWPSYWALFPVVGISLVLLANKEDSIFTNNYLAQWLGDRSYSLYLWHWPIVVALYFMGLQTNWSWVLGGFTLSIVLAHLSYTFVETPTRQYLTNANFKKEIILIGVTGLIIGMGAVSVKIFTFEERSINQTPQAKYQALYLGGIRGNYATTLKEIYRYECDFYDFDTKDVRVKEVSSCVFPNQNSVFIWGDSHARSLSFGIKTFLETNFSDIGISQVTTSSCKPQIGLDNYSRGVLKTACNYSNKYAIESIKKTKPILVILAQSGKHEENNLINTANTLLNYGVKNILIVGPLPQWKIDLPIIIARKYWKKENLKIDDPTFIFSVINTDNIMSSKVKKLKNKHILYASPIGKLCNSTSNCIAILDNKKTPLSYDSAHLTKEGSLYVTEKVLAPVLEKILKEDK